MHKLVTVLLLCALFFSLTVSPQQRRAQSPPIVNGRDHPELISNGKALASLLRLLRHLGEERAALYIKARSLGDPDEILPLVREYVEGIAELDAAAGRIKDQAWPDPDATARRQLKDLQRRKELLVAAIASRLPSSAHGWLATMKQGMQLHSSPRPSEH